MKVTIGPYKNWIGPYQIADRIFFWQNHKTFIGDEPIFERWDYKLHDKFGDWLANSWVHDFCKWIHSFKKRKVKIHIDYYDTWSMDYTLAMIIHPMLMQLKATKHGSPCVDPEDAPTIGKGEDDGYGSDSLLHERWEWVLDEMIWTFDQIANHDDLRFYELGTEQDNFEAREKHIARVQNGLRLFGKYFQNLWD